MPEVVEVFLTSLWLDHKLKNSKLTKIDILGGRYVKVHPLGYDNFIKKLPMTVKKVESKGKFMYFELENTTETYYIMNTFGLDGMWSFEEYEHSDVKFNFQDKNRDVYFTDQIHYGTFIFTNNKKDLTDKLEKLGPDLLKEPFTDTEFRERIKDCISNKKGIVEKKKYDKLVVEVLMSQEKSKGVGCGIGNYLVADVLNLAGISPYTKIGEIYDKIGLSNKLSHAIKYQTKLAFMSADIGYFEHLDHSMEKFIKKARASGKYNFHPEIHLGNDKFIFRVYQQKKDPNGNPVEKAKIITGRTTYWSPKSQK